MRELDDVLKARTEELERKTLKAARMGRFEPDEEELRSLERLTRLVEIREAIDEKQPRPLRWHLVLVTILALGVAGAWLLSRVKETEVEIDLAVSGLRFVSSEEQLLSDVLLVSTLGVAGAGRIELPKTGAIESRSLADRIKMSVGSAPNPAGRISLSEVRLAPGTGVALDLRAAPGGHRLSLEEVPRELEAIISGAVTVSAEAREVLDYGRSKPIRIYSGGSTLDLDLIPAANASAYSPLVPATGLAFSRIEQHIGEPRTVVRETSTILSGTLFLEELDSRSVPLRPGERLRFESSVGEIRSLEIDERGIAFQFNGRVRGMKTGSSRNPRDLMPTRLEWFQAQEPLALLWATTLSLSGLALGLLRWLRVSA